MEISQIETFLAVASFGGFHRAAETLRVTQPAVSARIKALEESLGVDLFVRSPQGLTLSDAGRALRPHAEQLMRVAAVTRQSVHQVQPASGPLQIATALSLSVYFLPDVLQHFKASHASVPVNIRSGHSKEVLEMVLKEEAEIGLARSLQHPELETVSLGDDPLLLIGHPKLGAGHVRHARLAEVANWPLIFFDKGSSDWTLTSSMFRRAGLVANVALEVDTIETAKRMVERKLGLAFLPRMAVATEIRRGTLATTRIVDAEPLGRSLDLIHLRRRPLRSEAQAFMGIVREAMDRISAFEDRAVVRLRRRRK